MMVDQTCVLKMWQNYIKQLYCRHNGPENLELEREEEAGGHKEGLMFCEVKCKKLSRR